MKEKKEIAVGGQAVIEGVMMRGPDYIATAVRRNDGTIELSRDRFESRTKNNPILKRPVIRGFVSLIEMMIIGYKSLTFSANRWELDNAEENAKEKSDRRKKVEEFFSFAFAIVLALVLFGFVPYLISFLLKLGKENLYFNLVAGVIRVIFFVAYVWIISFLKDVGRLFEYHGAEHKSVFAYENNDSLEPKDIQKYTTLHPRCGTSFIFFVLLISILVFTMVDFAVAKIIGFLPSFAVRWLYHILLIPLISGVSYEVLKMSGKKQNNFLVKIMIAPGLALQRITTRPPDDSQVEVAVCAMKAALEMDLPDNLEHTWIHDDRTNS